MKKQFIAILTIVIMAMTMTLQIAAVSTTKLLPTNIPKSFPAIKQDSSYIVVNFWHAMTGRFAPLVDDLAKWFNSTTGKQKKIYVKTIFQGGYDAITIKMQATLQSGNIKDLPDLVQLSSEGTFSVKESKNIIYMQDMMDADKSFSIKDKMNKNTMWACSYKGKQLGIPFSNSAIVLHYNATAFKAAGLDPNSPPKTIAEYAEVAKKLLIQGKGSKPVRYGASNAIYAYQLSTWIPRQKGGTAFQFDKEDGRMGVPSKFACAEDGTLKAALTEWKKACDTNAIDYRTSSPIANFENGNTCMYMKSMADYDTIEEVIKAFKDKSKIFEHKMARLPVVNENDSTAEAVGGSAVYMFDKNDAKRKDATWQFVKFLCSIDAAAYWSVQSGYFPVNNDAVNTKYLQDELNSCPNKRALYTLLSETNYKFQEPWIPGYGPYSSTAQSQIILMAQGKLSVEEAVTSIAKKANSLLQTYWKANS